LKKAYKIWPVSESALIVSFEQTISETVHDQVLSLQKAILDDPFSGFTECVPAYASLTVFYDFFELKKKAKSVLPYLTAILEEKLNDLANHKVNNKTRLIEIPVKYDGEDLEYVAESNGLSVKEVIKMHASGSYRVYMLGFLPGFAYLGGMDSRIATPRRISPRLVVEAGSVGIAGPQTGIYPMRSPGGWQIIGKTEVPLVEPENKSPVLLRVGDIIKFTKI
jgi:inhibitor of KinA